VDSNDVYRNHEGVYLYHADNATITNNAIANNSYGIHLEGTRHAAVYYNAILDNRKRGLYYCCQSEENVIQGNVFMRNEANAWGYDGANTWDDGSQGNYWDDNYGSSYIIDDDNIDHHPLQEPPIMPHFPDSIYILFPAAGQEVNGSVVIQGVSEQAQPVDIRVDNGSWFRAQGNFLWRAVLDSTMLSNGTHTLQAKCGNASASLTIIIANQAETSDALLSVAPAGILAALFAALLLFHRRRFHPARHA
jgi:parallel beta-helix repeat protein